ncbi:flagellar basal body-associated FliL family protein [Actinoplanes hulinensis]|uniref:Flagellar protein FliL n=1 Tax=Actinoplanes hulinensis TaxID=1144547 RepID=A0ABS7AW61_9ACTN|nr:flagellar basal body-associated FliL family protein [Actinoplanes hulinensis]MBW6432960.1 flagellar basal body-associated FliL family protein [Actinoplanes hulinensis]
MSDENEAAQAPKSNKMLMIIIALAMVLLGGGGVGAFFMLRSDSASAAEEKPEKGVVVTIENPLTVNLADGHYLKVGFALQMTKKAGEEEIDTSEALNLAIEAYTGRTVAELSTEAGRVKLKGELLEKIEKAYEEDGKQMVMDLYFTSFVTQ